MSESSIFYKAQYVINTIEAMMNSDVFNKIHPDLKMVISDLVMLLKLFGHNNIHMYEIMKNKNISIDARFIMIYLSLSSFFKELDDGKLLIGHNFISNELGITKERLESIGTELEKGKHAKNIVRKINGSVVYGPWKRSSEDEQLSNNDE